MNEQTSNNPPIIPPGRSQKPIPSPVTPGQEQTSLLTRKSRQLVHDLRQPLTVLLGELEIGAFDGGIKPDKCEQLIDVTLQIRYELQHFYDFLARLNPAPSA